MPALPAVAIAYAAATFAASIAGGAWWMSASLAALTFVLVALLSRTRVALLVLLATVSFAAAGQARFEASDGRAPGALAHLEGKHEVTGTVRDEPRVRGTAATLELDVERIDGQPSAGGLRLTLPAPAEPFETGDRIVFTGDIERPPDLEGFDYAAYLRSRGIEAVAVYPDSWDVVGHDDGTWPAARLRQVRGWSIANIGRVLPEPESSLAVGLLLGAQRTMPEDLIEDLRATGTTHLVVVSGHKDHVYSMSR